MSIKASHLILAGISGACLGVFAPVLLGTPPIPYPAAMQFIAGSIIGAGGSVLLLVTGFKALSGTDENRGVRFAKAYTMAIAPLLFMPISIVNSIIGQDMVNWIFLVYLFLVGISSGVVSWYRFGREISGLSAALWAIPLVIFIAGPVGMAKIWSVTVNPDNPKADLKVIEAFGNKLPEQPEAKNVVFILLDTLRPDHLSAYDYKRRTSPSIDAVAGKGVLFENAFSQASWSTSATASLLTSLYPNQHGSVDFGTLRLHESFITIADAFKSAGFLTAAVSSNPLISLDTSFDQGFEYFDEFCSERINYRSTDCVYEKASAALNVLSNNKSPFFLYLHFFDPHSPYLPPKQYRGSFTGKLNPEYGFFQSRLINAYDDEILYVDNTVGKIMSDLEKLGLSRNTIIVITSDHGEEHRERGRFSHGHTVFDEVIHVPLILAGPDLPAGKKINALAESIDVYPTLLEFAGTKLDLKSKISGKSLVPLIRGEVESLHSEIFSSVFEEVAIRDLKYKIIMDTVHNRTMLFDIDKDPGEKVNIASTHKDIAAKMSKRLDARLSEIGSKAPPARTGKTQIREMRERLKALGYVN